MDVIDPPADPGPDEPGGDGAVELDLRPRQVPPTRKRRGWMPTVVIVLVLVAAGFVVSKALTSATLFFYNADEAVAKQQSLGTSRFRIQGTVENDVKRTGDGADFTITFNGVQVPVDHQGDPPALFKPGEPVVLEGHFDATHKLLFDSDLMLVKHSGTYVAKNSARIKQAVEGGKVPPKSSTTSTTVPGGGSSGRGSSGTP
jgi:cytochrome c-type biogenesis protein CcmE